MQQGEYAHSILLLSIDMFRKNYGSLNLNILQYSIHAAEQESRKKLFT